MECTEFRELIGADPAAGDPLAEEHLRSCSACRAYAERLHASERLISQALRFDVQALQQNFELQRRAPKQRRLTMLAGTAAALVAVIALWALLRPAGGGALAADVAEHWYHEPQSWVVTDARVSNASLESVLRDTAQLDMDRLGPVTYVQSCFFRGHWVPHLVVQGQAGPIMVLLLPDEAVQSAELVTIPEQSLEGVIVPHGRGSVAILGHAAEPMQPVQQNLLDAVEWSI